MSTSNQASSASASNFTAIFQAAHDEYKKLTGHDLDTHPFASELDSCNSPDVVLNVLQKQAQTCNRSRKGDEKLLEWLNPTVNVLFTFSATLGEGIGLPFSPAKTIFTGIGVLLGAMRDVVRTTIHSSASLNASIFSETSRLILQHPAHNHYD
ncbi:hypothetical protein BJV77DRAFT_1144511 [Russula vinacea]|nr:hypothetical protein BJV77DRAFT_1144511 [Russula vinacea]